MCRNYGPGPKLSRDYAVVTKMAFPLNGNVFNNNNKLQNKTFMSQTNNQRAAGKQVEMHHPPQTSIKKETRNCLMARKPNLK